MKKHLLIKSGCSILIASFAALIPLSAAQATESQERVQERVRDDQTSGTMQGGSATDGAPASQYKSPGARGPMRSDMADTRSSEKIQNEWKKQKEMENRLFPLGGP